MLNKNNILLYTIIMLTHAYSAHAQELKFRPDSTFCIVQFTDIHYQAGVDASRTSIAMMEATLDDVKPDLVVFTGDIVVKAPTKEGWDEVLDVVISRRLPYMITLGNHDDESEMKRKEVAQYVSGRPLLLNKEVQIANVSGYLNAAITIKDEAGRAAAILYVMDSHAYSSDARVKGYGWFDHSQVAWYKTKSTELNKTHRDTLPALAFFHIPLPEYKIAFDNLKNKRIGVRYEDECAPVINTGMYAAMFESGDVMGTFVGHDHINDYLVDYYGVALAYGCFSGSENTYQRSKSGARVIRLRAGQRMFETYIREFDGTVLYHLVYPFTK